ncbi:MAG: threonine synthase [Gemmatimonadetes bacterium]|nr:threonine synthase [Gemmatimonadota bacterium]
MRYRSTRGEAPPVLFSEALLQGLAPDGGLYVPDRFPEPDRFPAEAGSDYAAFAAAVLRPFLEDDPLAEHVEGLCREAFDFPVPLVELPRRTAVLELFHGPTAAFKDFGARFLAGCFQHLPPDPDGRPRTILVATSGDTGAAVAAACHGKQGLEVAILFPEGAVSPRQQHQLTCWDGNVTSFAVRGTFDDCQRMVKELFQSGSWPGGGRLTSANSINVGRLLPQVVYYAWASLQYRARHGRAPGFIVPSGNVGNAVGAFWAQRAGFPVARIALATNANDVIPAFAGGGPWEPRPSVSTLANAMDVGHPSNMERLFDLAGGPEALRPLLHARTVSDEEIRETIRNGPARWGQVFCPHTATAVRLREEMSSADLVVVATAHPAKFEQIVEPLVGHPVEVPPALAELLARPTHVRVIEPTADSLRTAWAQERTSGRGGGPSSEVE